jgi:hypothetical protein
MRNTWMAVIAFAALGLAPSAFADLDVVVDGVRRPEYNHRGTTYVEAIRGREYTLRISNPYPYRVAVALAVDGLNTIDARHADGWNASKWVLAPYESTEISGWQVSDSTARRFFFTGERNSYGALLGATENLGVIEAIFYREHRRPIAMERKDLQRDSSAGAAAAPRAEQPKSQEADDYAATGMGDRTTHEVERVDLELDPHPIASMRIRYEFRPELVKLGVLSRSRDPLERREKAQGFEYCPQP